MGESGIRIDRQENERLLRVKDAILSINTSLLEMKDTAQLFDLILDNVLPAIEHANVGCVLLLDKGNLLRIAAAKGYPENEIPDFSVRMEDSFQWKRCGGHLTDTLIINDLQEFTRELGVPLDILKDRDGYEIKSTMSTPLIVDGKFLGLLNLDSRGNDVFDDVDRTLVEVIRSQIPIIIKMFKSFERIKELLSEKELFIREVHHRIKNNMATIASILSMQASSIDDPRASAALGDARNRVQSMMTLYEKLYVSSYSGTLNATAFLPPLIDDIVRNFHTPIALSVVKRIADFPIAESRLQPICMIINEILTNSMKYAFTGKNEGRLEITAKQVNGSVRIEIADDGNGFPPSSGIVHSEGFGLMLVRNLAKQMGGKTKIEQSKGTRFTLEIPD